MTRPLLLAIVVALACGSCSRDQVKARARARITFDTSRWSKRPADVDEFLATEVQVVRDSRVLQRVKEKGHEVNRMALSVEAHPESTSLDISFVDRYRAKALEACNQFVSAYLEVHAEDEATGMEWRIKALKSQLAASPGNAELERELQELETDSGKSYVTLHSPCKVDRNGSN